MARNYPRKQTVFIFFICLIIVFGTSVLVNGWPSTKKRVSFKNPSEKTLVVSNNNETSTTENAEAEWEKSFFDEQAKVSVKNTKTASASNAKESLNPTDLFGRNFFTKYAELRRSGLTSNAGAVDAVALDLINQSLTGIKGPANYSPKDISTTYKSDTETTRLYAQNLMSILSDWMPEVNEVVIATQALESGDMDKLKAIDSIIVGYKTAVNRLKSTIVPESLALPHLDLINGISMQIFNAESLRDADKDPLTALAAISLEVKSLEAIAVSIGKMQNAFSLAGITFVVPTSGSILQSR